MTETEKRIEDARTRLTGETGTDGLQAWFREEVERETGWRPGKSTVHRFVHEKRGSEDLEEALAAIEERASKVKREIDVPDFGDARERNVLLIADWLRGAGPTELGERYGVSKQRAEQIVRAAGVKRPDE